MPGRPFGTVQGAPGAWLQVAVLSILAMLCKQSELARGQIIQAASLKAVIKALSSSEAQASPAAFN